MFGGQGDDVLEGGDGNDELFGVWGDDTLSGGVGHDLFYFHTGAGSDVILDLEDGIDLVVLEKGINGLPINSAGDLASYVSDQDGNAVLDFGNGDTLTLVGVSAENVQADPSKFFQVGG
jgi:Ca2+-binding RTX toxin-like protein